MMIRFGESLETDIKPLRRLLLLIAEVKDHSNQSSEQRPNVELLGSLWKRDQNTEGRGAHSPPELGKRWAAHRNPETIHCVTWN